MYNKFSVAEASANFSTKTITVNTNFMVDATTVDTDTVKFFITIDGENKLIEDYKLSCDNKNILIELNEYPEETDEFYLFILGVRDRLGRELTEPYMKTINFSPNIATKLIIQAPANQAAIKSKKVHVEVTILDDDMYTLKLIDDSSDIVIFDINENGVEDDIAIYDEANIKDVLELSDNTVRLEVSTDNKFFKSESITFNEHDSTSTNVYKVRADNIARIGNTLAFDLFVDKDRQFFIRARLESRNVEQYFGSWSEPVMFMVKSEELTNSSEDYLNEMLFTETIFEEEYEPVEVVSKTEYSYTDQEFYIEFNKPVLVLDEMLKDECGNIFIGKGYLIRRDI